MARRSPVNLARAEVLAFLENIKDHPEDTPRLILADWLEEQGDPRGEFIRIQCQRALLSEGDPRSAKLASRARKLLAKHRDVWLGVLAEKGIQTDFRRGLVSVRGSARKLLSKRLGAAPPTEALAWVDRLQVYDADAGAVAGRT